MLALLTILLAAVVVGKTTRRITPAVQLALLLIIAGVVVAELVSWSWWEDGTGPLGFLPGSSR
jgi:hypothetical protein